MVFLLLDTLHSLLWAPLWPRDLEGHVAAPALRKQPTASSVTRSPWIWGTAVLRFSETVRGAPLLHVPWLLGTLILQISDQPAWEWQRVQEFDTILPNGLSNLQPAQVSQGSRRF